MRLRRGVWLMLSGVLLIAAAAGLTTGNLMDERQAGSYAAGVVKIFQKDVLPAGTEGNARAELLTDVAEPQTVEIDGKSYLGVLEISALDLVLPVLENWDDASLKLAPCRYTGSYQEDSMIIAGHNYKSHFGGLSQLQAGDSVLFTDVFGGAYEYQVFQVESLDGADTEGMERGDWDLTLFTCTYDGASRVTIRCQTV